MCELSHWPFAGPLSFARWSSAAKKASHNIYSRSSLMFNRVIDTNKKRRLRKEEDPHILDEESACIVKNIQWSVVYTWSSLEECGQNVFYVRMLVDL